MAKIIVKVRKDIGDPGVHMIYGKLEPGKTVSIEEEHFGDELFERPDPGWLSPHERKDKERAEQEGKKVGKHEPTAPAAEQPAAANNSTKEGK